MKNCKLPAQPAIKLILAFVFMPLSVVLMMLALMFTPLAVVLTMLAFMFTPLAVVLALLAFVFMPLDALLALPEFMPEAFVWLTAFCFLYVAFTACVKTAILSFALVLTGILLNSHS